MPRGKSPRRLERRCAWPAIRRPSQTPDRAAGAVDPLGACSRPQTPRSYRWMSIGGAAMSNLAALKLKPVRAAVSAGEWATRVDLAACFRLTDLYGMSDMIYTHA